ncbi:mediator of RNA polymerase II transcription subunit 20-like [Thrips palmi]|uniref:Mediator of RNA polymerase II transcription subunit 20 n=1 Tax=Thrips palmi TaxID=161013 RepID=A0A6P8ZCZ2_THRPL|nr:mediator of RNA polymerase II transcription subunit 20-like [Thrips palmi]
MILMPNFGVVVAGPPRTVHLLNNSEQPATVFSILESGQKQVPLVSDPLFMDLMKKLASVYTGKQQTRMEAKGPRFEVADFLVKLGTVTMNQNFKGVLVEVEYRPCVVPAYCWELIREFMQGFLGTCAPAQAPVYLQNRMQEIYQPLDTIQQYLEQFREYRKAVTVR